MKNIRKIWLVLSLLIIAVFAFPGEAFAAPVQEDRTVFGESYILESGRILDGDLRVFGGVAEIREGATVDGNVFVLGGLVTIDGEVTGYVLVIGGTVNINETAMIEGDLISPASHINLDPGATILGDRIDSFDSRWFGIDRPFFPRTRIIPRHRIRIIPIFARLFRVAAFSLLLIALGAFLLLILPRPVENMTDALRTEPWHVFGYGALTALVMLVGGTILTITICLIPFVVIAGLVVGLATLVGWLALGYELGKRIATNLFKTSWHPAISAAVGNLILYVVAKSLDLIPCLGAFLVFVAMLFGLGMAVVTLFGTYRYPRGVSGAKPEPTVLFEEDKPVEEPLPDIDQGLETDETVREIQEVDIEPQAVADQPIEALDLGGRIENILIDAGLTTTGDVLERLEHGDQALLDISGIGEKSLADVKSALRRLGYELPGDSEG